MWEATPPPQPVATHEPGGIAGALLVQADGSPHRWLGPDGPEWTLIGGIDDADDATGRVEHAVFRAQEEQEDAAGSLLWLRRVAA